MKRDDPAYENRNARIWTIARIMSAMFAVLVCGMFFRQIFMYDAYLEKGIQQSRQRIVKPGARGDIFDRNGRLLVGNRPMFSAVVYFNGIRSEFRKEYWDIKRKTLAEGGKFSVAETNLKARENVLNRHVSKINEILGSDYKLESGDFNRHFSENQLLPLPFIKDLSLKQHAILAERLDVNGPVQIYTDSARYYPYGDRAAHILGYVRSEIERVDADIPGDNLHTFVFKGNVGKKGLEKAFDDSLSGRVGAEIWVVDKNRNLYDLVEDIKPQKGESIYCSIDIDLQCVAEDALQGRKGAVVALDVKTGEILAMASSPTYDPNTISPRMSVEIDREISAKGAWLNRATQGLYPPGSTFKIVTAVAGVKSGAIDENTMVECTGSCKVGNKIFHCHNRFGHGYVNLSDAISKSCNVFFYEQGLKMGIEPIAEAAKTFGLDSDPGIELVENSWRYSIVASPEFKRKYRKIEGGWSLGDTANTAIGQGYMLQTPLQMACFAASFARGETRTRASIIHNPQRVADAKYHGAKKIDISPEMYEAILNGMERAATEGTAKKAKIDWLRMAAKSGTAQIRPLGKPLTLAWMIAFAPVEKPEIAIAVIIEGEIPGDASGGATAGPVVRDVFEEYFKGKREAEN